MSKVGYIFNSLYESVTEAQKAVETRHLENVRKQYFTDSGEPKTTPITVGDKTHNIPLYSLTPHHNLIIDEVSIDFEIDLKHGDEGAVGFFGKFKKSKMANITIKFKGTDKAEGWARIGTTLNKQIPNH